MLRPVSLKVTNGLIFSVLFFVFSKKTCLYEYLFYNQKELILCHYPKKSDSLLFVFVKRETYTAN